MNPTYSASVPDGVKIRFVAEIFHIIQSLNECVVALVRINKKLHIKNVSHDVDDCWKN